MNTPTRSTTRIRGFSLIEILVVVAILFVMLILVGNMLSGRGGDGDRKQTPKGKALGAVCMSNLSQIRNGIQIQKIGNENEANPQSLAELKFPAEVLQCPDGKAPYRYDPTSGEVRCTYSFHLKF